MSYAGPLGVNESPLRSPATRFGGAKSSGLISVDTQVSTTRTLVFAVKNASGVNIQLRNGGSGGTVLWQSTIAGESQIFNEPLEFPDGLYVDVTTSTGYILYKD